MSTCSDKYTFKFISFWKTLPVKLKVPSTIKLPCNRDVPYTSIPLATLRCLPTPTPPATVSAPVSVLVELLVLDITVMLENVLLPVIVSVPALCTRPVSSIVTFPIIPIN